MMDDEEWPGLLTLPLEVLTYLGYYLSPQDLLALSASCQRLRTALNNNLLWRRYTGGGHVGQALASTTSLVSPTFVDILPTTLEPLCQQRLYFLKQSRLLNNLRRSNFLNCSVAFDGYLSDFESNKPLNNRQITFGGVYLFTIDYTDSDLNDEIIKVFNIERDPYLFTTIKLLNHTRGYSVIIWIQVVGNKLVIRKDDWFDIYEIKLPDVSFSVIYSIDSNENRNSILNEAIILGHLLFVENHSLNVTHVWDLENGQKINDISPNIVGRQLGLTVLGHCKNHKRIIFSVGMWDDKNVPRHVSVYDVISMSYTPFSLFLSQNVLQGESYGLIDDFHVVLLTYKSGNECSVFVYDYNTSALVAQNASIEARCLEYSNIISNCLVLPTMFNIKILSLRELDTIWILEFDCGGIIHELPQIYLMSVEYLNISDLCHVIIVRTEEGAELWDFEKRRKIVDFPNNECIGINDTFSKLLLCGNGFLNILNFW